MKRYLSLTAILIATSLTFSNLDAQTAKKIRIQVQPEFRVSITVSDDDPRKIMVYADADTATRMTIAVFSQQEGYVLTKEFYGTTYRGALDFKEAVNGDYRVEVSLAGKVITKKLSLETREVTEITLKDGE